MSNADAFDFEGGLRYYLRPEGPIRTYVAGAVGLRFLQATDATFRVAEVGLTLDNLPYFKGSALLIFGGDAGISYDLSDTIALGVELGLRYQGKPGAEPIFADPKLQERQRYGQPLVTSNQRLCESAVLMRKPIGRPRRTRRAVSGRMAASLVALALSAFRMGRVRSAEQPSTLPPLPQVEQDVASPSAKVRRQALRGLRERGGPETLPLLARLLGDAEMDIREGAVEGVIGVFVTPPAKRSVGNAAEAFEAARFWVQPWSVPPELPIALVKALADE